MTETAVLSLAQEVLNPGEWVTAPAAKILLGLTGSDKFYLAVNAGKFRRKNVDRASGKNGRPYVMYLYSDLCAYADDKDIEIGSYMKDWLKMIVWADTQKEMPSDGEIAAHVLGDYSFQDLKGLIETRKYRGVEGMDRQKARTSTGYKVGETAGESNPMAKLTEEKVIEIKQQIAAGVSDSEIAECWGVHPGTIRAIRCGRTWKNVGV